SYDRGLAIAPDNAAAINDRGWLLQKLNRPEDALSSYDKALAIDPTHKGALEYEGEAYLETNQLPKAMNNLATLKRACGSAGCAEIAQLQSAIGRYKKQAKIN
ncbi:MAG: tetratricopeptide repeat protein, partial [Stellaceae bacterium]